MFNKIKSIFAEVVNVNVNTDIAIKEYDNLVELYKSRVIYAKRLSTNLITADELACKHFPEAKAKLDTIWVKLQMETFVKYESKLFIAADTEGFINKVTGYVSNAIILRKVRKEIRTIKRHLEAIDKFVNIAKELLEIIPAQFPFSKDELVAHAELSEYVTVEVAKAYIAKYTSLE